MRKKVIMNLKRKMMELLAQTQLMISKIPLYAKKIKFSSLQSLIINLKLNQVSKAILSISQAMVIVRKI